MAHVARAVAGLNALTWPRLVRGELKLAGPTVTPVTTRDPESLPLLADFFTIYASDGFQVKEDRANKPVVPAGQAEAVRRKVIPRLQSIGNTAQQQAAAQRKLQETTLPDFLAGKVLERGFDVSVTRP